MKKQPHVAVRTTLLSAGYNLAALSARPALRRLRAAKGSASRLAREGEFANSAGLSGVLSGTCLSAPCAMPREFDRTERVPDNPALFGSNSL